MDGDYTAAAPELASLAGEIARQAGPLNQVVLDCRHKQAGCLAGLGKTRDALAALEALLPDFEAAYTSTGEDTLGLRYEICWLLAVTGQRDLAWPRTTDLLVDVTNVYGDDHPETAAVKQLLVKLEQLGE